VPLLPSGPMPNSKLWESALEESDEFFHQSAVLDPEGNELRHTPDGNLTTLELEQNEYLLQYLTFRIEIALHLGKKIFQSETQQNLFLNYLNKRSYFIFKLASQGDNPQLIRKIEEGNLERLEMFDAFSWGNFGAHRKTLAIIYLLLSERLVLHEQILQVIKDLERFKDINSKYFWDYVEGFKEVEDKGVLVKVLNKKKFRLRKNINWCKELLGDGNLEDIHILRIVCGQFRWKLNPYMETSPLISGKLYK